MARKTLTYTVETEGRDQGKVFKLTEMSAADAENWAIRAFFAIMNAGVDVPDEIAEMGMAGLAEIWTTAIAGVSYEAAKPLLEEMMDCVQRIPDPSKPNVVRALDDSDIEEVKTRLLLRKAVFNLHVDFLGSAAPSTSE